MSNSEQQPPERVWIPRTLAESLSDEQLAQTDVEYVRVQQPASEPCCECACHVAAWPCEKCGCAQVSIPNAEPPPIVDPNRAKVSNAALAAVGKLASPESKRAMNGDVRVPAIEPEPEWLREIEQRCNAATEGPWVRGDIGGRCCLDHFPHGEGTCDYRVIHYNDDSTTVLSNRPPEGAEWRDGLKDECLVAGQWDYENGGIYKSEDAEFIAAARTDIPKLITAYREALAERQEWLNWADSLTGNQHYLASKMRAEISARLTESRSGSND